MTILHPGATLLTCAAPLKCICQTRLSPGTRSGPYLGGTRQTCITVVVGRRDLPAPAYLRTPAVSGDRYDVLIGTTVLRYLRFTYDGPEGDFSLGPV